MSQSLILDLVNSKVNFRQSSQHISVYVSNFELENFMKIYGVAERLNNRQTNFPLIF